MSRSGRSYGRRCWWERFDEHRNYRQQHDGRHQRLLLSFADPVSPSSSTTTSMVPSPKIRRVGVVVGKLCSTMRTTRRRDTCGALSAVKTPSNGNHYNDCNDNDKRKINQSRDVLLEDASRSRKIFQFKTLVRILLPSVFIGVGAFLAFPFASLFLVNLMSNDPAALTVLSQDSSQFVQNFLNVSSVLFSILVGQT